MNTVVGMIVFQANSASCPHWDWKCNWPPKCDDGWGVQAGE